MTKEKRPPLYKRLDEASKIMSRLMASMPAATFEMETFSRLAGIVTTKDVPTAAMECKHRPRLLINPAFVEKNCKRDEHLFLLVMHELWHVMLAHTSLYPRVTQAQNIAFDAIINAGLMRKFSRPEYMGFFDAINPPDQFPHLLLRPPVGWPDKPQYPTDMGPTGTNRILRQLYPPKGARRPTMPFYDEILDLIKKDQKERGVPMLVPVLLGDHESDSRDAYSSAYLKDAMGRIVKKWTMDVSDFSPPGQANNMNPWQLHPNSATQEVRRAFSRLLRRALGKELGDYRRKERLPIPGITGMGVLPNPRDRLNPARKLLGMPGTLWSQRGEVKARVPERRVKAHVYLDVSGSMSNVLPYLLNLLAPYVAQGKAKIYQFSTLVDELSLEGLKKGLVNSTRGTQIFCVTQHMLEHKDNLKQVIILTDGYTGRPRFDHVRQLQERNMKIHVVLPGESPYDRDLASIATSVTVLPRLR
ncbi:MAG: VWA domain-containing protein [Anaerolineae bacterium]|nr:VWA domain-containing protein [Anaerolineae bacterium]MDQ7037084.1 VWA domain-containing protein [Anaerolineae bacterium]